MSHKSFRTKSTLKLALLSALALGAVAASLPAFAVNSATVNASATVVLPIALAKVGDISFGKFAPGTAPSVVTVFTDGTRTQTGGAFLLTGAPTVSTLNVSGEASTAYTVTYTPSGPNVTNAALDTMAVTYFSKKSTVTDGTTATGTFTAGTLSGAGAESIIVGAQLAVGALQAPGLYSGSILVSVDYN
jgi:hypothetical protein